MLVGVSMVRAAEVMTCEKDADCQAVNSYDLCMEIEGES